VLVLAAVTPVDRGSGPTSSKAFTIRNGVEVIVGLMVLTPGERSVFILTSNTLGLLVTLQVITESLEVLERTATLLTLQTSRVTLSVLVLGQGTLDDLESTSETGDEVDGRHAEK